MLATLLILGGTVVVMAAGKFRSDMVALGALLCMMLFGVLTPAEALTGFSNAVIFVMAGMFVISGAIVRTGLAAAVSGRILGVAGNNVAVLFALVMILTAFIGSLVSNTGTVAIMMPIVVGLSLGVKESPSRFLMPLAFMSSIGGMFTLIGNSSNIVVNDVYVRAGNPPLTLFSFFPVGAACFLFGMLVLAPITYRYLSRRRNAGTDPKSGRFSERELAERYRIAQNMYALEVPPGSEIAGMRLSELHLPEKYGAAVSDVARSEIFPGRFGFSHQRASCFFPGPATVLRAGDVMRVIGSAAEVRKMAEELNLRETPLDAPALRERQRLSSVGVCELVVMSSSRLVALPVAKSGLREQFGVTVLGIQRGGRYIIENLKEQTIQAGDALLVQGARDNLARLEEYSMNWVVVGRSREKAGAGRVGGKMPLVVVVVLAMVGVMAFNVVPTVLAVLLAAMALILGGCFKNMDEAYSTMNWETLVMLACLLPMALAMEKVGIVGLVSERMVVVCSNHGPYVALAVIYGVCSALNVVISTTPVSLLAAPIALHVAESLGYDPLPFLIAVATSASMCFASPFSTPSNALVMSAGRYSFIDYLKVGLPLQVLMGAVMVVVIPLLYPFAAAS